MNKFDSFVMWSVALESMIQGLQDDKTLRATWVLLDCVKIQEEEEGTSDLPINLYKRSSCSLVKIGLSEMEARTGFSSNAVSMEAPW